MMLGEATGLEGINWSGLAAMSGVLGGIIAATTFIVRALINGELSKIRADIELKYVTNKVLELELKSINESLKRLEASMGK